LQLHVCMHAALGWWPPLKVPLRDVAQVAHFGQVDWEELAELAARWKLRAVVRHAMQTSAEILEVGFPTGADPLIAHAPTRKERRILKSYATGRRNQTTAISTLRAIRGPRAKAAYIRALMFPEQEFLAARSGSRRAAYRHRWAVPLRAVTRRRGHT
jgi:hypothetical protein